MIHVETARRPHGVGTTGVGCCFHPVASNHSCRHHARGPFNRDEADLGPVLSDFPRPTCSFSIGRSQCPPRDPAATL